MKIVVRRKRVTGEEMSWGSLRPEARVFIYLNKQIEDKRRWGIVRDSGREMSQKSFGSGAGLGDSGGEMSRESLKSEAGE